MEHSEPREPVSINFFVLCICCFVLGTLYGTHKYKALSNRFEVTHEIFPIRRLFD